jgi:hypothetical protein
MRLLAMVDPDRLYLFPPRLRRGLRRKETLVNQLYRLPYTFPPTNTSTVVRSSVFHVPSPIHALVSPR